MEESQKREERYNELLGRARSLEITIAGNSAPEWCSGNFGTPVRTGTLQGHALYRIAATLSGYGALSQHVCLEVYLGPEGFKNPPQLKAGEMRPEVKCILVKAQIQSTPQSVKADEAVARQLLEKVDYDGLAKLLTP